MQTLIKRTISVNPYNLPHLTNHLHVWHRCGRDGDRCNECQALIVASCGHCYCDRALEMSATWLIPLSAPSLPFTYFENPALLNCALQTTVTKEAIQDPNNWCMKGGILKSVSVVESMQNMQSYINLQAYYILLFGPFRNLMLQLSVGVIIEICLFREAPCCIVNCLNPTSFTDSLLMNPQFLSPELFLPNQSTFFSKVQSSTVFLMIWVTKHVFMNCDIRNTTMSHC